MPDQVGGRGKGVARIIPGQKKYKSYGLSSVKELPDSAFVEAPELLPKAESVDLAHARIIRAVLGEKNEFRYIQTPLEPVVVNKEGLRYIAKERPDTREVYANFIIPTLTDPNEVWLTEYDDGSFRRRFIKLFRGKRNMLVVARENTDASVFWNTVPADKNYADDQREGTLLYKND